MKLWTPNQWNQMLRLLEEDEKTPKEQSIENLIKSGSLTPEQADSLRAGVSPERMSDKMIGLQGALKRGDIDSSTYFMKLGGIEELTPEKRLNLDLYSSDPAKVKAAKKGLGQAGALPTQLIYDPSTAATDSLKQAELDYKYGTPEQKARASKILGQEAEIETLTKPKETLTPKQIQDRYLNALTNRNRIQTSIANLQKTSIITSDIITDAIKRNPDMALYLENAGVGNKMSDDVREELIGMYEEEQDEYQTVINEHIKGKSTNISSEITNDLNSRFPPNQYKNRRKIDNETGKEFISDGTKWYEITKE